MRDFAPGAAGGHLADGSGANGEEEATSLKAGAFITILIHAHPATLGITPDFTSNGAPRTIIFSVHEPGRH